MALPSLCVCAVCRVIKVSVSNQHPRRRLQQVFALVGRVDNLKSCVSLLLSAAACCCVAAASSLCILSDVDKGHMGPTTRSGAHSLKLIQAVNV